MASKKTKHIPPSAPAAEFAHPAPEVMPQSNVTELPARAFELGFAHLTHAFDFTAKLMNAKDVDEVLALQSGFAHEQASSLKAQAAEMNDLAVRTARGMQETFARSMKEWAKPAA